MKILNYIPIWLIVTLPAFCRAQDSISIKLDLPQAVTSASPNQLIKTLKITGHAVPAAALGYGLLSLTGNGFHRIDLHVHHEITEKYPRFATHIDDKLQYAPAAAVYALNLAGVRSRNNFVDRTAMYLISNSIMGMTVDFLKIKTNRLRPDGSARNSFPSGHTATAFVAAEFMAQEFKGQSFWFGASAYATATATGSLRMLNNRHWLSDVIGGASIGILVTKGTYAAYPWLKKKLLDPHKKNQFQFILVPLFRNGAPGYAFAASF